MKVFITTVFLLTAIVANGQTRWELKKNADGMKIYAGTVPNSNIKAVKVQCSLNTTLSQLAALLLDAKAHEQWVYSTKVSYIVKNISEGEQIYYSEMTMPWPLQNRDVVVNLKISQDPETKIMRVSANAVNGHTPVAKEKVRVVSSHADWTVTPAGNGKVNVEYVANADPGGSIPSWAVNMFCTKGPYETFKKLNALLGSGSYKNGSASFIKD